MSVSFFNDLPDASGDPTDELNLCNANARALLDAMDLASDDDGFGGEVDIATARRGIIRARNRRTLSSFTRPGVDEPRCFEPAFTDDDLLHRLARFEAFVEESARRGATRITWG